MSSRPPKKYKKAKKIKIYGPWGSSLKLPVGRLPIKIGSNTSLSPDRSIYPNVVLSIPLVPFQTTMAAGALNSVLAISYTTVVENWASRFASLFDEYCIVGMSIDVDWTATSATETGKVLVGLDEADATAPTFALMASSPHLDISVNNAFAPLRHCIKWKARDYKDLQFTSTATVVTPVYVKAYSDVANCFTTSAVTGNLNYTGEICVQFRGYAN